jgi:hypothetical protein
LYFALHSCIVSAVNGGVADETANTATPMKVNAVDLDHMVCPPSRNAEQGCPGAGVAHIRDYADREPWLARAAGGKTLRERHLQDAIWD